MKLNKAQENLLQQINTGAYIKTRSNPNTFTVYKAGYYHWIIRRGTLQPFIRDGTVIYDNERQAYVKS